MDDPVPCCGDWDCGGGGGDCGSGDCGWVRGCGNLLLVVKLTCPSSSSSSSY